MLAPLSIYFVQTILKNHKDLLGLEDVYVQIPDETEPLAFTVAEPITRYSDSNTEWVIYSDAPEPCSVRDLIVRIQEIISETDNDNHYRYSDRTPFKYDLSSTPITVVNTSVTSRYEEWAVIGVKVVDSMAILMCRRREQ